MVKGVIVFRVCSVFDGKVGFCIGRITIDEFSFGMEGLIAFVGEFYLLFLNTWGNSLQTIDHFFAEILFFNHISKFTRS